MMRWAKSGKYTGGLGKTCKGEDREKATWHFRGSPHQGSYLGSGGLVQVGTYAPITTKLGQIINSRLTQWRRTLTQCLEILLVFWRQHIPYLEILLLLIYLVTRRIASRSRLTCKYHCCLGSTISGLYNQVLLGIRVICGEKRCHMEKSGSTTQSPGVLMQIYVIRSRESFGEKIPMCYRALVWIKHLNKGP